MGLFSFLRTPKAKKWEFDWVSFQIEQDKSMDRIKQSSHDFEVEKTISDCAFEMFRQWLTCPEIEIDGKKIKMHGIFIGCPLPIYYIYDMETAKYKDCDIDAIIKDKYTSLVAEFEEIYGK